jgi:hypothetical protein
MARGSLLAARWVARLVVFAPPRQPEDQLMEEHPYRPWRAIARPTTRSTHGWRVITKSWKTPRSWSGRSSTGPARTRVAATGAASRGRSGHDIQRERLEIRPWIERVWGATTLEEKGTVAGGRRPDFSVVCSSLAVNSGWGESVQTYTVVSSRRLVPQSRAPIQLTRSPVLRSLKPAGEEWSNGPRGLHPLLVEAPGRAQVRQERGGSGGPG